MSHSLVSDLVELLVANTSHDTYIAHGYWSGNLGWVRWQVRLLFINNSVWRHTRWGFAFCNDTCQQQGPLIRVANQVPEDALAEEVEIVRQGACPICRGPGPIDIHTAYSVWSALILTSWNSHPRVSCTQCGRKSKFKRIFACGILGWWGFPFGLLMTPIQIGRNFIGLFKATPAQPSESFQQFVRLGLAQQFLATKRAQQQSDDPPA